MRVFVTGGSGFVGRNLIAYLLERGHQVVALARSDAAAAAVTASGAEVARGDLSDVDALRQGMQGCDWIAHSAAFVADWGGWEDAYQVNVIGTQNVLDAAGERRVVHVSTEAVLCGENPIIDVDETAPRAKFPAGVYPKSKGMAEERVEAAKQVIVRPRFIWGRGDTSVLPQLLEAVNDGVLRWADGGHYRSSTCHVTNVCEGILCAAERGEPGGIYFLTDGDPVDLRDFLTAMFETQGVDAPTGTIPRWLMSAAAGVCEVGWTWLPLPGRPPLTRMAVKLFMTPVTVDDSRARREIGYVGNVSIDAGLLEMGA